MDLVLTLPGYQWALYRASVATLGTTVCNCCAAGTATSVIINAQAKITIRKLNHHPIKAV